MRQVGKSSNYEVGKLRCEKNVQGCPGTGAAEPQVGLCISAVRVAVSLQITRGVSCGPAVAEG